MVSSSEPTLNAYNEGQPRNEGQEWRRSNWLESSPINVSMQLDQADIKEFNMLYEAEFGEQIDYSEAERMASELLGLYETIWLHKLESGNVTQPDQLQVHSDQ